MKPDQSDELEELKKLQEIEERLKQMEDLLKQKFCPSCREYFGQKDNYCGYCGRALEWKELEAVDLDYTSMLLYGPPYRVKLYCPVCKETKFDSGLGAPRREYFCTICGTKLQKVSEGR